MENQLGIGVEVLVTSGSSFAAPKLSKIVDETTKYWKIEDGRLFKKEGFNTERGATGYSSSSIYFLTPERKSEILRDKRVNNINYNILRKIDINKCTEEELSFLENLIKRQSSAAL